MTNPVLVALAQARFRAAPMFARWCELNRAAFCPAAPATVAHFVRDCAALGIERLWPAVQDISKLHTSIGLADPTLGGASAAAISEVANVSPPRSWPDDCKQRFRSLPYDLQVYVVDREARRDKALRRAQNEAAAAKQKLAALQPLMKETTLMKATRATTLEDRIKSLRAEVDAVIDARVDAVAKDSPGVPKGVIRNLLTARASGCSCAQYLELDRKE
jgi:hypothetical protein